MKYIILLIYFFSTVVHAQEEQKFPTKESLVSEIIRSINENDKQALIKTFHPEYRKVISIEKNIMLNDMLTRWMAYTLDPVADIQYGVIEPNSVSSHYKGKMTYPVPQNGSIWIKKSKDTKYTNVSLHISTSHDNYGWYQVFGVPTENYATEYVKGMKKHDAIKLKVEEHVRNMNQQLRKDIVILLNNNDFVKAVDLYKENTKVDKRLSQRVVRVIRKEEGLEQR